MAKQKDRRRPQSEEARPPSALPSLTPDVMTIEQLAAYLKLAQTTLYKKVQAHEIPFTKVGNLLRFTKVSIDQWLARNTFTPSEDLFHQFARLQSRYFFRTWLEGHGTNWKTLTDSQLTDLVAKALEDLRSAPGGG